MLQTRGLWGSFEAFLESGEKLLAWAAPEAVVWCWG